VHDHFLPYRRLDAVDHAFWQRPILRELPGLDRVRQGALGRTHARHASGGEYRRSSGARSGAKALEPKVVAAFRRPIWAAFGSARLPRQLPRLHAKANASGEPSSARPHLLERLKTFKTETLRFLTDFDVPFTNNLPSRTSGWMKVKMKISGSFRTLDGAQIFARLSPSFNRRKQRANILKPRRPAKPKSRSPSTPRRLDTSLFGRTRRPGARRSRGAAMRSLNWVT